METKVCKYCGIEKPLELFKKNKRCINGRCNKCKKCSFKYIAIWRKINSEKYKAMQRKYFRKFCSSEKGKLARRQYDISEKKKKREIERQKKWREANPEKSRQRNKEVNAHNVLNMNSCYIKGQLRKKGFADEVITNDLIEVQRLIIKTKRLCKTLQNSEKV